MRKSARDLLAGLIFVGFGLAFAVAAASYDLGSAVRMGPGYFPLVLGIVLTLLGAAIALQGFLAENDAIGAVPWRGLLLIIGAVILFGVGVRGLGLVPALFLSTLMTSFASRRTTPIQALLMAAGLTAFCYLIFVAGLGLPLRPFGPWIPF